MFEMIKSLLQTTFSQPATRRYPYEVREPLEGTRGAIDMDPDVCVYCGICQKKCPANAIKVTRKPNSWTLDPFACIICGECVEACPKSCIRMEKKYRAPSA
jgi:NADH-quinone oxidoreductase subunit I